MFDEKLLYTDEFKALDLGADKVGPAFKEAGLVYPEFVTSDPPKTIHMIFWKEGIGFTSPYIEGIFKDVEDLYDLIHEDLGFDADFDKSVIDSGQVEDGVLWYSLTKKSGTGGRRLLLGSFDFADFRLSEYVQFLKLAKMYIADPSDVVISYDFIRLHPAFWYRWDEKRPNNWNTEDGHKSVTVWPHRTEDGKFCVSLEHGSTVPPEYNHHYHDFRLDVYGDTFEEAYVLLAERIHKFFFLDGSERPDIPYEKSELELELEDRMASLDEDDD